MRGVQRSLAHVVSNEGSISLYGGIMLWYCTYHHGVQLGVTVSALTYEDPDNGMSFIEASHNLPSLRTNETMPSLMFVKCGKIPWKLSYKLPYACSCHLCPRRGGLTIQGPISLTYIGYLQFLHGKVITFVDMCRMKWHVHSQISAVEVWRWISNFLSFVTWCMVTDSCWD